jgi:hypothetical protein
MVAIDRRLISGEVMEEGRRASKWLRSAYVIFGIVFTGIIGGLIELISIADYINYGIVKLLQSNPAGPELVGKFLFPKNWFSLFIVLICLMLLFPATSILRYFSNEERNKQADKRLAAEIVSLRQDINDIIRYSENITNYMYPGDVDLGRFDTKSVDVKYDVSDGGDTLVEALITIECANDSAHFYRYWIDADPESEAVDLVRDLRFSATDSNTGRKLDWLLVKNGPKNKTFAIFFPEVSPGMQMKLHISYVWRGYMRKLIDLGAANFRWNYLSKSPNARAPVKMEWSFSNKLAKIKCRIAGRQAASASVYSENRVSSTAWVYYDPEASMNASSVYTVEFSHIN